MEESLGDEFIVKAAAALARKIAILVRPAAPPLTRANLNHRDSENCAEPTLTISG